MQDPKKYRFYGRRFSRPLRNNEKDLLDSVKEQYFIDEDAFANDNLPAKLCLEVGFGDGEHLIWQALQNPDVTFIGADPYINGVAKLLKKLTANKVSNVKIFAEDVRYIAEKLPDASLEKIFVLFPDPWHKKRHHKRRIVSPENLDVFARLLKPGGELRLATDDENYLNWMMHHLMQHGDFSWAATTVNDWVEKPEGWPETKYELKAKEQGRTSTFLKFKRV